MLGHPIKQGSDVGRHARRGRKSRRIGSGQLVDHKQPRIRLSAMLGVDGALDRRRKHQSPATLEPHKGISPCRVIGREACASDGDEAPTIAKTRERRSDVPEGRIRHPSIDIRQGRERRVHQDDARHHTCVEVIIDLRSIEPRDLNAREQMIEQRRTGLGQLVQHQGAAGELGKDGEQTGARRWLENTIGGRNAGCGACRQPERDGRRELLKRLAVLGTPRVGRQTTRDLREHRQHCCRRASLGPHGRAEFAKEQNCCRLADVIGGLPVPGAGRVRGAEGRLHSGTQNSGIDATAAFELGQDLSRGPNSGRGEICSGTHGERRGDTAGKRFGHGRVLRRAGMGRTTRRSPPTPTAQTLPARLSLSALAHKNGDRRCTPIPKQLRDGPSHPAR